MINWLDKSVLITGGTGSFGSEMVTQLLRTEVSEIRILSRDEKKQEDMRQLYGDERLKFYMGDVRDRDSVDFSVKGVNYIFHAAALKQVPSCEFFPIQAYKTNVLGTENVLDAAIKYEVQRVVCLSTDKAVYPINAMGISKAMMEKVMVAKARYVDPRKTVFCATRYGNVMGSRGSVIPLFLRQIKAGRPLTITDPKMTRFMMSIPEAIDLVLFAFENGKHGDLLVQKAPAATIDTLAKAILKISNIKDYEIEVIGRRHGEKLFETLMSSEEMAVASKLPNHYCVSADFRELNYERFVEKGNQSNSTPEEYNSHNTFQLNTDRMAELLKQLKFIRDFSE